MNDKEIEEKIREKIANDEWTPLPWKAWGSWFSWGSPVGLSIFLCSLLLSCGVFILLLHYAEIL